MIFVTVGTTDFSALIRAIDEIAPTLDEEVIMQIGRGKYEPQHCQFSDSPPHWNHITSRLRWLSPTADWER